MKVDLDTLASKIVEHLLARGLVVHVASAPVAPVASPARQVPSAPEPRWMKLPDFAARWSIGKSTLYERLAQGLPFEGEGRMRRIPVAAGDAWMREHGCKRAEEEA
jgi:hypothetical protein